MASYYASDWQNCRIQIIPFHLSLYNSIAHNRLRNGKMQRCVQVCNVTVSYLVDLGRENCNI